MCFVLRIKKGSISLPFFIQPANADKRNTIRQLAANKLQDIRINHIRMRGVHTVRVTWINA